MENPQKWLHLQLTGSKWQFSARYLSQMKQIILYLMQINYCQYKLVDSRNSDYVKGIIALCGFFNGEFPTMYT